MASVTYFVALPFVRSEDGELVAGEAQDRQSAGAAESLAMKAALEKRGAAFSEGDGARGLSFPQ